MEQARTPVQPIRDPDKLTAIKTALREEAPARDFLLFTLGLNTALPVRDLLPLRVRDVVDTKGKVRKVLQLQPDASGPITRIRLNAAAAEAVRLFVSREGKSDRDALLFRSRAGDAPLNRAQVWRLINGWCRAAGLTGRYGGHTLRKTWGYMALKHHSIPLHVVQKKLGHATPGVTRKYLGVERETIENVEDFVNL